MRRDQRMRAGGRAPRATRPIEIGEESSSRGEIGPIRSAALLRQPNRAHHCEGPCGRRRDPHEPHAPRTLARRAARFPRPRRSSPGRCGKSQSPRSPRTSRRRRRRLAGRGRRQCPSRAIDQPDMREHDHNQGQSAQFVDDANSLGKLWPPFDHGDPFGLGSIRVAIEAAAGVFALRVTSPVARLSRACLRIKSSKRTERPRGGPMPEAGALHLL